MRRVLSVLLLALTSMQPVAGREDRAGAPAAVSLECRVHRVRGGAEEGLERWLRGLPEEQRGERLRQVEEHFTAAELELVAVPRMVVFPGSEAGLEFTHEINCPVDYQGARIPEAWGDRIVPVERDPSDGLKMVPESPALPPFPGKLEGKQIGLVVSAGIIERDGGSEVKFEIDHSALVGFRNRGKPVDLRPAQGEGKALRLIENRLLEPAVLEQKDSFSVGVGETGVHLTTAVDVPADVGAGLHPDFGAEYLHSRLDPLLIVVSVKPIDEGLQAAKMPEEAAPVKQREWSFPEGARFALGFDGKEPDGNAAADLQSRLSEIGIDAREVRVGAGWKVAAQVSDQDAKRIGRFLDLGDGQLQIKVLLKVMETSEPLGPMPSPFLDDAALQKRIRELCALRDVDLMTTPSVVMRPFQDAKIEIVKEFIYPTSYSPPETVAKLGPVAGDEDPGGIFPITPCAPREFVTRQTGAIADLRAILFEDRSVELEFQTEMTGFSGFLNFSEPITVVAKGRTGKDVIVVISENRVEGPVFESHRHRTRVRIADGSTLLLGGSMSVDVQEIEDSIPFFGDLPFIGRFARTSRRVEIPRFLYYFVTVKVVDRAGE